MSPHFFAITHPYRKDFVINPIDSESKIMKEHFEYLQDLMNHGKLYLAGPTLQENDPFGIYIFSTETLDESRRLLENDPSVKAKLQTITTLRPLRISLHDCTSDK
ncbi:MAG: YciI family protein [Promethearchaeota archaeon]